MAERSRKVPAILLAGYLGAAGALVLWPTGVDSDLQSAVWRVLHDIGISWLTIGFVEVAANVVLFMPLGLLTALLLPRNQMWIVAPGVLSLSTSIELAQAVFLPDRHGADISDVIANTAGGLLGLGIAYAARRKQPVATKPETGA